MIRTFTSLIFGIKRHSLSNINIKLIFFKYSLISNRISNQLRCPTMQQHLQKYFYGGNGSRSHKQGGNQQQPGGNQQHHGRNQQQHGRNQQSGGNQQHHGRNQQQPGGNQQHHGRNQQQPGGNQQHGRNQQPGGNQQHHGRNQQQPGGNQQHPGGNRGPQKEEFEFFFGPKFTFSQMHPAKFTVGGIQFCCMEQYMQYQKAMTFGDDKTANQIMSTQDPKEHKKLGRKVSPFRANEWGWKSVAVVKKGNIHKFQQNPPMKKILFATYPKTLVEASPRDRLWGIGMGKDNPNARDRSKWRGQNLLGQTLTEVRDYLMTKESIISSQSSSNEKGHEAKKDYSSYQHKAKLDDKNSSSSKIDPKAVYHKTDHEKYNHNKKDKHVSKKSDGHEHRNLNRYDTSKSGRHDEQIPSRSGETTPQKERSGDVQSSSSKKRKYEDDSRSERSHQPDQKSSPSKKRKHEEDSLSERSHQPDEKSLPSKKRKDENNSRSDRSHQPDQKSSPSKKRKHEEDSCSDRSYQADEKSQSSKKRKYENNSRSDGRHGKGSSENNENFTNNKDEKSASILEPPEVKKEEQDKEKDRVVETEKICYQMAGKSEARATEKFIETEVRKSEDDRQPDSGKQKQKKIKVRLPETKVSDKDERSNIDAVETSQTDAPKQTADYVMEGATQLEKELPPTSPAETKCVDLDTSLSSNETKP